jgi:hypothetical protein
MQGSGAENRHMARLLSCRKSTATIDGIGVRNAPPGAGVGAATDAMEHKAMSKSHMPPVPPENRSDKGPGDATRPDINTAKPKGPPENLGEQARQGNINQNTHHQGYQQDR